MMSNLVGGVSGVFVREKRKEAVELANLPLLNRLLQETSVYPPNTHPLGV